MTLEQVKYAPKLYANLFSVTQVLLQDWKLRNDKLVMHIEKDGRVIKFDHILRMKSIQEQYLSDHVCFSDKVC